MTERLIAGPFNRVEGDLEVRLDVVDGHVRSADVVSPMYRGFEPMMTGRPPSDALVIVPRICGICSVSQSVAAARALADAAGVAAAPNGRRATQLMAGCENASDHLTQLYLFFLPDFTRAAYARRPWFDEARRRWSALEGVQSRKAIAARQRWLEIVGTLGGRWPHTHSIQPGGSARPIDAGERLRLQGRLREFRRFLQSEVYGAELEEILSIDGPDALQAFVERDGLRSDFGLWLAISSDLQLHRLGAGPGRLLGYGAFEDDDGRRRWPAGVWHDGSAELLDDDALTGVVTESTDRSWYAGDEARHPSRGATQPDAERPRAYSWNKAPRWAGHVVETGALARQVLASQPLVERSHAQTGANVHTRVLARWIELAALVPVLEAELAGLRLGEPFHVPCTLPDEATGRGLHEAARGALGHWLRIERGRIALYQIVAPTSWNFSPRDALGQPGALEAALVGAPVADNERRPGTTPLAVQHVVRSFDPCMVCTAH